MKKHLKRIIIWTAVATSAAASYSLTQNANQVSQNADEVSRQAPYVSLNHKIGPPDIYPLSQNSGVAYALTSNNVQGTICNPNWSTKSIRPPASYTTSLKIQQIKEYGYSDVNPKSYEEDHFISLEIGGDPKDPHNLWPEPYNASIPDGGAKSKDKVENFLHAEVCSGKITIQEAQREITTDWYKVLKNNNL